MFVGCLWGAGFGYGAVLWLQWNKHVDRDANVEVVVTLATPFLVYYGAEMFLNEVAMSGVLAVVSFGLVFAAPFGRTKLDPSTEHFLHEFWGMVGYLINTLLFTISGLVVILNLVDAYYEEDVTGRTFAEDFENGVRSPARVAAPPAMAPPPMLCHVRAETTRPRDFAAPTAAAPLWHAPRSRPLPPAAADRHVRVGRARTRGGHVRGDAVLPQGALRLRLEGCARHLVGRAARRGGTGARDGRAH